MGFSTSPGGPKLPEESLLHGRQGKQHAQKPRCPRQELTALFRPWSVQVMTDKDGFAPTLCGTETSVAPRRRGSVLRKSPAHQRGTGGCHPVRTKAAPAHPVASTSWASQASASSPRSGFAFADSQDLHPESRRLASSTSAFRQGRESAPGKLLPGQVGAALLLRGSATSFKLVLRVLTAASETQKFSREICLSVIHPSSPLQAPHLLRFLVLYSV